MTEVDRFSFSLIDSDVSLSVEESTASMTDGFRIDELDKLEAVLRESASLLDIVDALSVLEFKTAQVKPIIVSEAEGNFSVIAIKGESAVALGLDSVLFVAGMYDMRAVVTSAPDEVGDLKVISAGQSP